MKVMCGMCSAISDGRGMFCTECGTALKPTKVIGGPVQDTTRSGTRPPLPRGILDGALPRALLVAGLGSLAVLSVPVLLCVLLGLALPAKPKAQPRPLPKTAAELKADRAADEAETKAQREREIQRLAEALVNERLEPVVTGIAASGGHISDDSIRKTKAELRPAAIGQVRWMFDLRDRVRAEGLPMSTFKVIADRVLLQYGNMGVPGPEQTEFQIALEKRRLEASQRLRRTP